jgi:hypothetical protein
LGSCVKQRKAILEAVFKDHPGQANTLTQSSKIPGAARSLSHNAYASFLLQSIASLQLVYAIDMFRECMSRAQANALVLTEAARRDEAFAKQVLEVDGEVRDGLVTLESEFVLWGFLSWSGLIMWASCLCGIGLGRLSRSFDSPFALLKAGGIGPHNVLACLEAKGIPCFSAIVSS